MIFNETSYSFNIELKVTIKRNIIKNYQNNQEICWQKNLKRGLYSHLTLLKKVNTEQRPYKCGCRNREKYKIIHRRGNDQRMSS